MPNHVRLLISCLAGRRLIRGAREKELGSREKIKNDDSQQRFLAHTAWQCWNNVVTIRNNVATMLQRCVALKIVVANRLV